MRMSHDQTRVDYELAVKVHEALHRDERLSADSIDVTVIDGLTTLSGTVQSFRRKAIAVRIAESIPGCRGVRDRISVDPPGMMSDHEVANKVRLALESHADITKEVIIVSVKAGVVTLRGHVASQWERELAGDVALGAKGVRDVSNLLLVDLGSKIEDEALTSTIQYAISRTKGLEEMPIRVAVNANTAVLSGWVDEAWQRKRAEGVAWRFRVSEIKNDIVIDGVRR